MKLIDISHTLNNQTPIYPGDYRTSLSVYRSIGEDHYNSFLLQSCLHTGTHVDLPLHLLHDNRTVDAFPIDRFIGRGVFLDVCGEDPITMKPAYEDIDFEQSVVLLYTGFDRFYFDEKYFSHHPRVNDELAEFFLAQNIKMLGMDMPAPDYPPFKFHKALLAKDIIVLENLTNLQSLVGINAFEVSALPLKISAEASWVRAVCRLV